MQPETTWDDRLGGVIFSNKKVEFPLGLLLMNGSRGPGIVPA